MQAKESLKFSNSLEIQKRLSYAKNYNTWIFSLFEKHLGSRILEIGSGFGNFTEKILDKNFICASDIEQGYVAYLVSRYKDVSNLKVIKCDISSADALALKEYYFDTILCFNVLEHIMDDESALSNIHSILTVKGTLCMIVPAFKRIFGEMDRTDHHLRRYQDRELAKKVTNSGFRIVSLKYINFPGFFGWWFNGKVLKRKFIPFRQMSLYDKLIPLVSRIERFVNPPFGQSLAVVARKAS